MHKERKETTHVRVGEKNIHQHINKISTMYVNNDHKTYVQDINLSKVEKRKKKIQVILTTSLRYQHSP